MDRVVRLLALWEVPHVAPGGECDLLIDNGRLDELLAKEISHLGLILRAQGLNPAVFIVAMIIAIIGCAPTWFVPEIPLKASIAATAGDLGRETEEVFPMPGGVKGKMPGSSMALIMHPVIMRALQ